MHATTLDSHQIFLLFGESIKDLMLRCIQMFIMFVCKLKIEKFEKIE